MKGKCDRLYKIWYNAISRCTNPSDISYKRYGGRGITFYPEWISDYHAFKNWALSNGYQEHLTLDRIDPNKGYSPDNCRWVTIREQANNRRTNVLYTIDGETKTLAEWCRTFKQPANRVKARIRHGWNVKDALSTPNMSAVKDLTGKRFGRLTVVKFHHMAHAQSYWECKCDCGTVKIICRSGLVSGETVSCGCYAKEIHAKHMRTVGQSKRVKVLDIRTGKQYDSMTECASAIGKSTAMVCKMLQKKNSYLTKL